MVLDTFNYLNFTPFSYFLCLGKVAFALQDLYAFMVVGLYALVQLIYFASKMEAPVLHVRTVTLVLLIASAPLPFIPSIPWSSRLLLLIMGVAGVASFYSLARQLQWKMGRR